MYSVWVLSLHSKMIVEKMTNSFDTDFMKQHILIIIILCLAVIGCDGESTSLYDPNYEAERPDPTISEIVPEDGWLAGVDGVVIRGENFSEVPEENRVYFDGIPGIVNSATQTELHVRAARVVGDTVPIKVTIRDAVNFSNETEYKLDQAVFQAPGSISNDNVLGITVDSEGNIYYSIQESDAAAGIRVWRADDETVNTYIPSSFNWNSLIIGPDGLIYGARNVRGIYRESPGGTIDDNAFAFGDTDDNYIDMDFDEDGNLWTVGDNTNIYRIDIEDATVTPFPFEANLRAVRYYDGKLYLGGFFEDENENTTSEIWTMDVNNGQASNPLPYLNLSDLSDEEISILSLTFDESGRIYIGADTGTGIYTWSDDEGLDELYPGLIEPEGYSLSWHENFLIAAATNREETSRYPLKIDLRREGAPYYGIENE